MPERLVLVVEDYPDLAGLIVDVLALHNYRTTVAHNGVEAIKLIAAESPDVITLDLSLPGTSGIQILASLGEDPRTASIPVVIVSAHVGALQPGGQVMAVIEKPFQIDHLLEAVDACVRS